MSVLLNLKAFLVERDEAARVRLARSLFTPNVHYDDPVDRCHGEDFFSRIKLYEPLTNLTFLDELETPTRCAVVFNGLDSVAGLWYRSAWLARIAEARIVHVTHAMQILSTAPNSPSHG